MKKLKSIKIFILCIFLMLLNVDVVQAYKNINFENITNEDGLSQGTVETMIQDSKGYIWIGTNDGLNRYNGYDFKVYRHDEDVENTIANNYIVDLKEDNEGNIWAGTAKGLSKINTRTDEIKNYYSEINNGGLSHYNIGEVLITKDREIIVGINI